MGSNTSIGLKRNCCRCSAMEWVELEERVAEYIARKDVPRYELSQKGVWRIEGAEELVSGIYADALRYALYSGKLESEGRIVQIPVKHVGSIPANW
jgi:hypothetical protein